MSEEEVPTVEEVDRDKTLLWIEERLCELGFNEYQAASLADAGVDHHAARVLIKRGCPHDLAVDILL